MKTNIQIKNTNGFVLFEHESENNSLAKTLAEAIEGGADLRGANLRGANLHDANLGEADLRDADLRDANLGGANLDFSVLHFSCKSLHAKTSEKQRIQLCYHFLSWIANSDNATEEEKGIFEHCKAYANRFHRTDVEKFK